MLSHEAVPTSFKEFKMRKVCSLTTAQLRVNIQLKILPRLGIKNCTSKNPCIK